jgi:alpha-glucosidase
VAHQWWQRAVVYQIYPQSFQDSNGDGVGDLPGITRRLDHLVEVLGVDAIWINPFYRSPMVDGGYDVTDHQDIDPRFGTLADFDELLAAAHHRGLRVIIDYLPACTSDEHPWFIESRAARMAAKRDWYVWRDPGPDGGLPNNWLAHWGGPAWTWHQPTGQFYLHTYLDRMPDLNWDSPGVRQAMFDVARYWLDRGVDGFRVDSAHIIGKDSQLPDNPANTEGLLQFGRPHGDMDSQLHIHDRGSGEVHAIYRRFREILDDYSSTSERVSIGEIAVTDPHEWASYYGTDLDELHMPFNFRLIGVPWNAKAVRQVIDTIETILPPGAWPTWVLGNHDEPRVASRLGPARARVAMMLLLTLRGTPTVYYGDELGLPDIPVAPDRVRDPWEHRMPGLGLGRDPERSPMRWETTTHAGFCLPDAQPWLPLGDASTACPVSLQLHEPQSMLLLTRKLLRIRRIHAELALGCYRTISQAPDECLAFTRDLHSARSHVVLNFSDHPVTIELEEYGRGEVLAATHVRDPDINLRNFVLRGDEGVVIKPGISATGR